MIKKYNNIIFTFLMLLSGFAIANDNFLETNENLSKYTNSTYSNVDDVFKDLSNRLILGLFGKDMLALYLHQDVPSNIISEINSFSQQDVEFYARPFNVSIIDFVWLLLLSINILALIIAIILLSWYGFSALLYSSKDAEFLGRQWDTSYTNLKVLAAFLLILPVFNVTENKLTENFSGISLSQVIVVKFVGMSSYTANKIYDILVTNTPNFYPEINLPNADAKTMAMIDIIRFTNCVNAELTLNEEVPVRINKIGHGNYEGFARTESCELSINFQTDVELNRDIEYIENLSNNISIPIDNYEDLQKEYIRNQLSEAFIKANRLSQEIIAFRNRDVIEDNQIPNRPKNWHENCNQIYELNNIDISSINRTAQLINTYAECMSHDLILENVKVPEVNNIYSYLNNNNYLSGNSLELCVHEYNRTPENNRDKATISSFNQTFQIDTEQEFITLDIDSCLSYACSSETGGYHCANAINAAKQVVEREEMVRKGWMTSGAYIYKTMNGMSSTNRGNNLLNSLNTNFNILVSRRNNNAEYLSEPYEDELSFNFTGFQSNSDFNSQEIRILNERVKSLVSEQIELNFERNNTTTNSIALMTVGKNLTRIRTCIEYPLTITDQFSCGHVTEEIHRLGLNLMEMALTVKTALLVEQIMYKGAMSSTEGTTSDGGRSRNNMVSMVVPSLFMALIPTTILADLSNMMFSEQQNIYDINSSIEASRILAMQMSIFVFANDTVATIMDMLFWIVFTASLILAFVIPLIPLFKFLSVILDWLLEVMKLMIAVPIWAASLMAPSEDHSSMAAKKGIQLLLSILLKAPLIVIGITLAWTLTNVMGQYILSLKIVEAVSMTTENINLIWLMDIIVTIVIYAIILIIVYNMIFDLIEKFHTIALGFLFNKKGLEGLSGNSESGAVVASFRNQAKSLRGIKWTHGK